MASLDSTFFMEKTLEPLTYRAILPHTVPGEGSFGLGSMVSLKLEHSVERKWPTVPIDTDGLAYGIEKLDRKFGRVPMYKLAYAWEWMFSPYELRNATNWYTKKAAVRWAYN